MSIAKATQEKTFFQRILRPPRYGWADDQGELVKPTAGQLWKELFHRVNIFTTKKNWAAFSCWMWTLAFAPFFLLFFFQYFTWPLFAVAFLYGMLFMGSYATVWYHRFSTHKAFLFKSKIARFLVRNMSLRFIPEEIYVVSHNVHHGYSEKPGDPYNAHAGFLYCFFADATHQPIALDLSESDYKKVVKMVEHTGIKPNSYEQYQKWGSITSPWRHNLMNACNWLFWYGAFFLIGGHALSMAIFTGACVWAFGIRTFNYEGHGRGVDRRQEGIDFNTRDIAVNQIWPGFVAGEWHSNHHLYPNSAQSGFLPYQIDLAWYFIKFLSLFGLAGEIRNSKQQFMDQIYTPYKQDVATEKSSQQAA